MINRRHMLSLLGGAATLTAVPRASGAFEYETRITDPAELEYERWSAERRLPKNPRVVDLEAMGRQLGKKGGRLRTLIGGQRDVRMMPINSYSRLVGYDTKLQLQPDILASYDVEDDRIFTFHLREGHRWSDGSPFTSEDFRYCWEDVIQNRDLLRGGPPADLKVDGEVAKFEVLDALTVRYSWSSPAPAFLPQLASPVPLVLALPGAYLRRFHARYQTPEKLGDLIVKYRVDDWQSLHTKVSRQNRPENPDLPTLEAWRPRTAPPAEQFVFERNAYFHRVDTAGVQLPYINHWVLNVASTEIITAKTATGESDLQSLGISFPDYTLLRHAQKIYPQKVSLWTRTQGSSVALMPNLNCSDPVWRGLFQDVRMRRALSLAIDRAEINKVIFYGLARESANTILPESPLFKPEYATAWSYHDPDQANALLDEVGLAKRDRYGTRLLPDGRTAGIMVETAGESTLETDVLELITDHFREVGLPLYIRTSQRDIFRSRALGGEIMMSVAQGLDNGVATSEMSPNELAPTSDAQLQWPLWGLHHMSAENGGTAPDLPAAQELLGLLKKWRQTTHSDQRLAIWTKMLEIHADQVFSIGTINGTKQPLVKASRLRNIPEDALFGFEPTSYLGAYMPDTFWYEGEG
ncbi:ABC transporter substrate-binding protein [Pseudooceanicola spongiae]|uniref:ABC transporter substrate-binding protein n=1 Tax=Pseudooceanicola spongiae TaxID=2613965 RepID=A0A7L9WQS1_9RHOB|nr:ABC transporter substrate-binding protein [Pseudooceanicola spongiae]QOL81420.1 ABC transporter substrate-binding protein [Pseudooceanicola spongiae]